MADRTRLLLTGAAGFLGSHMLEYLLVNTDWDVIATDRGDRSRRMAQVLSAWPQERVTVIQHDLAGRADPPFPAADYVIAMASGVDVAASLAEPESFVRNNVNIALSTFGYCRKVKPTAVILVSTGEVYGPVKEGRFPHQEWAPVLPPSPYAASKAGQEAIATAYWQAYGVPVTIVNTMNLFGERQDPAKFLPTLVRKITAGEEVTVYPGSRCWLHAEDLADALLFLLRAAAFQVLPLPADRPRRYNVVGSPLSTELFAVQVASALGKPLHYSLAQGPVRPGHEPHYALNGTKMAALGWQPPQTLNDAVARTASWTLEHREWL